jgi:transposase-like protein
MANARSRSVPITAAPPAPPRREYWRALVEECGRSGVSQAEFCRRRGIPAGTLSFWKSTLAREAGQGPRPPL